MRATSKAHALALLAERGDTAKLLSGGQSLIPMMNLRIARPTVLIDISTLSELSGISQNASGLRCGATTKHVAFARPAADELRLHAALSRAALLIGHEPIRSRGTIGGSVAHADKSSEWCLMALALDALIEIEGPGGIRHTEANDFFKGFFSTDLGTDELLTAVIFPSPTRGTSLVEYARRVGDFAIIAVASSLVCDPFGNVKRPRIAIGGIGGRPVRNQVAEQVLSDVNIERSEEIHAAIDEAAYLCASAVDVDSDSLGSPAYKRRLTSKLVTRALRESVRDWQRPEART